jgi:adenosylcobinamide-phosphate synthase
MAGALDLSLAGPRVYDGVGVADAWMGDGRREVSVKDIHRALALYRTADAVLVALVAALAGILIALA